uniref:Uncharacterized protein n=1 Tax=Arundo donax TaxID=35708 RepID=A0A0A9CSR8_ARUDO
MQIPDDATLFVIASAEGISKSLQQKHFILILEVDAITPCHSHGLHLSGLALRRAAGRRGEPLAAVSGSRQVVLGALQRAHELHEQRPVARREELRPHPLVRELARPGALGGQQRTPEPRRAAAVARQGERHALRGEARAVLRAGVLDAGHELRRVARTGGVGLRLRAGRDRRARAPREHLGDGAVPSVEPGGGLRGARPVQERHLGGQVDGLASERHGRRRQDAVTVRQELRRVPGQEEAPVRGLPRAAGLPEESGGLRRLVVPRPVVRA